MRVIIEAQEAGIASTEFEAFWRRDHDRLYRALAMTLGDPALAEEAVDEAMVRAYERWARVAAHDQPAGWVYRVAKNWAVSRLRWRSRRPVRPREELDRPVEDRMPDVDLARHLQDLDTRHRTVLVLRYYLQLTPTEVAVVLDVPVGTAKSRIHRAVEKLRPALEGTP